MINQKEGKKLRTTSWLLKLPSRDMKITKNKDQLTKNHKK